VKKQFTKEAIEAAFMKLLYEKTFDKVTVKDVVDECGLTRNTFYYYYDDTYDVLDSILQKELGRATAAAAESDVLESVISASVAFATTHPRCVRHLAESSKRQELAAYINRSVAVAYDAYIDRLCSHVRISDEDKKLISDFYRNAFQGIMNEWISGGMREPIDGRLKRARELFGGSIQQAVDRAAGKTN